MSGPWTFETAAENLRQASSNQQAVEELLRGAFRDYAVAEEPTEKISLNKSCPLTTTAWHGPQPPTSPVATRR